MIASTEVGDLGTFKPNPGTKRKEPLKNVPCKAHSIDRQRMTVELLDRNFEALPTAERTLIDIQANRFRPGNTPFVYRCSSALLH